jgi:hypothetical protein
MLFFLFSDITSSIFVCSWSCVIHFNVPVFSVFYASDLVMINTIPSFQLYAEGKSVKQMVDEALRHVPNEDG